MIKGESTVSEKGQLVIPKEIRQALDVQRGDKLSWVMNDDGTIRVTLAKGDLLTLRGRTKSGGKSVSVEEMDEAIKAGAAASERAGYQSSGAVSGRRGGRSGTARNRG
ncbi:hypothetical protein RE428_10580 [Marinobacter nanhaiticus D15-8W]|uniref:AbrB/MazE/SpoVT family DNA-binding domain-containing protein n=1 Tax=Marinobacter nanhaiticus D15-8W TaxID=626887 RepID=A0A371CG53_9GAMM|nr:AbrB/MazE/SpoVT family DNA-binding domain-containing protein [Marinobacter nanhaiticus D15-8W]BES70040.1 hypothetical protein RE428_10580 [Marinobacter nanhaiticus D15-8W]